MARTARKIRLHAMARRCRWRWEHPYRANSVPFLPDLRDWNLEFCCVVAGLEAFALGEDAEHRWIGVCYPSTEDDNGARRQVASTPSNFEPEAVGHFLVAGFMYLDQHVLASLIRNWAPRHD